MIPIKLALTGNNSKKAQGFRDMGQSPFHKKSSASPEASPAKNTDEHASHAEFPSPAKLSP